MKVIATFPAKKISAVKVLKGIDEGLSGYIPLSCITGRREDRVSHVTTPAKIHNANIANAYRATTPILLDYDDAPKHEALSEVDDSSSNDSDNSGSDHEDEDDTDDEYEHNSTITTNDLQFDFDRFFPVALRQGLRQVGLSVSRHIGSFMIGPAYDGKASDKGDVHAYKGKTKGEIVDFTSDLPVKPRVGFCTDGQELHGEQNDRDDLRKNATVKVNRYDKWLVKHPQENEEHSANVEARGKEISLREEVSDLDPHLAGIFHANLVSVRSISELHKPLVYRGLFDRVGYGEISEYIFSCANGYWKIAIELFESSLYAFQAMVAIGASEYTGKIINEPEELSVVIGNLCRCSDTMYLYERAMVKHVLTVLNMHHSGTIGADGEQLLIASIQEAILLCSVSGNHQYVVDLTRVLRDLMDMPPGYMEMWKNNPTAIIREKGNSRYHFDLLMEMFGVRTIKNLNRNSSRTGIIDDINKMYEMEAAVQSLAKGFLGEAEDSRGSRNATQRSTRTKMTAVMMMDVWPTVQVEIRKSKVNVSVLFSSTPVLFSSPEQGTGDSTMKVCVVRTTDEVRRGIEPTSVLTEPVNSVYYCRGRLEETMRHNADRQARYVLRSELGGKHVVTDKSNPRYPKQGLTVKAKNRGTRCLKGELSKKAAIVSFLLGDPKGCLALQGPHAIGKANKDGEFTLHPDRNESKLLPTLQSVLSSENRQYNGEIYEVATPSDLGVQRVSNSSLSLTYVVKCRIMDFHHITETTPPLKSSRRDWTGIDQCFSIVEQVLETINDSNVPWQQIVGVDGFDLQDLLEDMQKVKPKVTGTIPEQFVSTVLKPRPSPRYFKFIRWNPRLRSQFLGVFEEAISASCGRFTRLFLDNKVEPEIHIAGVGQDRQSRRCEHILTLEKENGEMIYKRQVMKKNWQFNFTGCASSAREVLLSGRLGDSEAVVLRTDNPSIWLSCLVMLSIDETLRLPPLLVETAAGDYFNLNEMIDGIMSNPQLGSIVNRRYRVINVVALVVAFGTGTTTSFLGVSQALALSCYLSAANWIGQLVSPATEEKKTEGWLVDFDLCAWERLFVCVYAKRDSLFSLWNGETPQNREEKLGGFSYEEIEVLVAKKRGVHLTYHMPDRENLTYHVHRVITKVNCMVTVGEVCPQPLPKLLGFVVTVKRVPDGANTASNGGELEVFVDPDTTTIDDLEVVCAKPKVGPGTDPKNLFGEGKEKARALQKSVSKTIKQLFGSKHFLSTFDSDMSL